ncbi:MAG: ABC transporter ATP-binding protein [Nitrososphaerales archaeon]
MQPAIQTFDLTKKYGDLVAVDSLNLEVQQGEIYGFLGPNGAGKTTTILMLLGLTEPTSGRLSVLGFNPLREPLKLKRLVGYLPENLGFYDDMTARQNLLYTARLNGISMVDAEDRIRKLLGDVGLSDAVDKKVSTFSKGMKQRLGMADVLLKDPKLMLLDEPTTGIDPEGVRHILNLIVESREKGKTVLLSSHLLYQVQKVCDRVGIFVKGRLIASGSIQHLGKEVIAGDKYVVEAEVPDATSALEEIIGRVEGVVKVSRSGSTLTIECRSDIRGKVAKAIVSSGYTLTQIRSHEYALDEIYSRYFEGESKS